MASCVPPPPPVPPLPRQRYVPESQARDYDRFGIPPDPYSAEPRGRAGIQDPRTRTDPPPQQPAAPRVDPRIDDPPSVGDYPVAGRTNVVDEVISPYPPNRRIKVDGFRSGQLAKDPQTGEIFEVP